VLIADEGLLWLASEMKKTADLVLKVSVQMGAGTYNVPTDLTLPQLAAIRQAVSLPLDIYVEVPDDFGGFVRHCEIPEMVRVAAPIYVKLGLRNAPNIYPSGAHLEGTAIALARERVHRAAVALDMLRRYCPEAQTSPRGASDLGMPVEDSLMLDFERGNRVKITSIETIPVQIPIHPKRAIKGGRGYHTTSPFLLVKAYTDEGIIGLGEVSCTPIWSGEDQVTAAHYIHKFLAPLLVGENPTEIERLTLKINSGIAGNPFTKSALEMALWDILGKLVGLPVYRLLGGPVREFVPTKFSVSGLEPEKAAEIAAWAVRQGFRTMKVKVGIEPEEDIARVRAVRGAVGPEVRLGVDANGGWSPRVAIQTIQKLYEYNIYFAEQPVPPLDVAWMADVRSHVRVPIMADESVYTLQDAMAVVRAGAADVLSVYVGKGGGIGPARKIAAVAEAAGLTCTVGSNLEMGVASAAMIHLAMATPGVGAEEFPCDILSPFLYEEDLLKEPLPITGGQARPFERPGLGVDLDEEKVQRYRVG